MSALRHRTFAMKSHFALTFAIVAALSPGLASACSTSVVLDGTLSIPHCEEGTGKTCVSARRAVYDGTQAYDVPGEFSVAVQSSPWRMYDGDGRILTVEELASVIRAKRPDSDRRVRLVGSWTSARPDGAGRTLAQRLSTALDGFPVDGMDGFLWVSPTGGLRTTHQAFSIWKAGVYSIEQGAEALVPLVPGAMAQFAGMFAEQGNARGVIEAGVGHDVFMLCPEGALSAFERAGEMGDAIGAYNAGLMHLDAGDRKQAITWLEKASALGEKKAAAALARAREASAQKDPG